MLLFLFFFIYYIIMLSNAYRSNILVIQVVAQQLSSSSCSANSDHKHTARIGMTMCGRRTRSATFIWLPLKQSVAHGLDKTGLVGRAGWRSSGCTLATVHSIESLLRHSAPRTVYFWPSHRHSTLRSLFWLRDDVISMRTALENVSEEFPCFNR